MARLAADEALLAARIREVEATPDFSPAVLLDILARQAELGSRRSALTLCLLECVDVRQQAGASAINHLAAKVREHDRAIKDACDLIRELDDPYGLGSSLDERISGEEEDRQ
jgi:hypothetical protein